MDGQHNRWGCDTTAIHSSGCQRRRWTAEVFVRLVLKKSELRLSNSIRRQRPFQGKIVPKISVTRESEKKQARAILDLCPRFEPMKRTSMRYPHPR